MKKSKKLLTCLFALMLTFAIAGCRSSKEQEAAAETTEAGTLADINSGTSVDTAIGAENVTAETTVGTGNAAEETTIPLMDALTVTAAKIETEGDNQTTIYLNVENTSEKDIRLTEWLSVTLDGQKIPENSWSTGGSGFRIDAGCTLDDHITINQPVTDSKEAVLEANLKYLGSDDTEPVKIIVSLEDINKSAIQAHKTITIEEQELYNANGIVVTLPEQKLDTSEEPKIHFENNSGNTMYFSFMDLTVDGELIREGAHNTSDSVALVGDSSDDPLPVGESLQDAVDSGRESGEISFVLFITENQRDTFGEAVVNIPYTIIEE